MLSDFLLRYSFIGRRGSKNNNSGSIVMIISLVFLILSPIFSILMQLAISRKREYLADASAVEITRNPDGLINALTKISSDKEPLNAAQKSTAHMYISNPFKKKRNSLWSTHPPVEKRIEALRNIH
jgi:heat shock protein HtpX